MTTVYSRQEAAKYLRISIKTLDELRKQRKISFVQHSPGGKVYFREEDLDAYLSRATHQARPEYLINVPARRRRMA